MKEILMPRFDPEMKTGRVAEWLKKEGDRVEKGEAVLRIDTEKVSMEVEAPASGILSKILVQPPEEVPVGTPLGAIAPAGEESVQSVPGRKEAAAPHTATAATTAVVEREVGQFIRASPAARKLAREQGVELPRVKGTGPGGRITSEDVETYLASQGPARSAGVVAAQGRTPPQLVPTSEEVGVRAVPLSTMRLTIAERMTQSWTQIPQVPLFLDVKLAEVEKFKAGMEKLVGKKVSFTAIIAKATASALRSFPELNARFENNAIQEYADVDISIAVALEPAGLVTPVIRKANGKTATELSDELEELAARAREGKLLPAELRGGTTTISNLASFGVDSFIPIINPPQVTILGVGRIRTDKAELPFCTLTLVFDHRVTDGARAARFLEKIKDFMESPYLLQMA